jgi:hypothetical protein
MRLVYDPRGLPRVITARPGVAGVLQLVSEPYKYNMTLTAIFLKTYGEDTLQYPYKDYSSLNRWQDNMDLLSVLYFSVTTHLRQGKKVSILVSGDVDSGPVASR